MSAVAYADTSALAKLVTVEPETAALRAWIDQAGSRLVTNIIGSVELRRVAFRLGTAHLVAATQLLGRLNIAALSAETIDLAARMPPAQLRTLDAIHVASAAQIAHLVAIVSYDDRMVAAASTWGIEVVSPGR